MNRDDKTLLTMIVFIAAVLLVIILSAMFASCGPAAPPGARRIHSNERPLYLKDANNGECVWLDLTTVSRDQLDARVVDAQYCEERNLPVAEGK